MSNISLSLICATKGRYEEVARLITSLEQQSSDNFELIIIDQNGNDLLSPLLSVKRKFPVAHIKIGRSGNTYARNFGLRTAKGDWVAFPDDDCWYPPSLVENVLKHIAQAKSADGFFVNWSDPNTGAKMFSFTEGQMSIEESFTLASCICLFFKTDSIREMHGFNESLGIGDSTLVKAGEEQDLMLRMISRSRKVYKLPQLEVYHKIGARRWDDAFLERIRGQGACDYYFTREYIGSGAALQLRLKWVMAYLYNVVRGNSKNATWYLMKLKGVRLSSKIRSWPLSPS